MSLPRNIATERLVLRATEPGDAVRAFDIQSNWNVTRNLRMAGYPPDLADIESWFALHTDEWRSGSAYRFAILRDGRMIGVVDVDGIRDGDGSIGYWLEDAAWGKGYASEAARAVVRFAFEDIGLRSLRSGHAADNTSSGRVLLKLGFNHTGDTTVWSRARATEIVQRQYRLDANSIP